MMKIRFLSFSTQKQKAKNIEIIRLSTVVVSDVAKSSTKAMHFGLSIRIARRLFVAVVE